MRRRLNRRNGGYVGDWRLQDQAGTITPLTPVTQHNKTADWYRPQSWLPMPAMTAGSTQMVAGLLAIFKGASGATGASADSNFVAFLARGAYVVDWGVTTAARPNGMTSAHADNTVAQFQYNWNDVPASTETPFGYRQVMIRITPQAGQNITTINMNQRFASSPITLHTQSNNPWLSIKASVPNCTSFGLGSSSPAARNDLLEELEFVGRTSISGFADILQQCIGMECLKGTQWSAVAQSCNSAFAGAQSMRRYPLFDTRRFTGNVHGIFGTNTNLEMVPHLTWEGLNDASIISTSSIFSGTSILVAPRFSMRRVQIPTTSITNGAGSMFNSCVRLKRVDELDLSRVRLANNMFFACTSLVKLPPTLSTPNLVNAALMFNGCVSLRNYPTGMSFANVNECNEMFRDNWRCEFFPTETVGTGVTSGITANDFGRNAYTGMVAPRLNWSKVTTVVRAYNGSGFPEIVGGAMTAGWAPANGGIGACMGWGANTGFLYGNRGLKILPKLEGLLQNTDIRDGMASPTELDAFFTALGSTAGRLNVTGNWGITAGGRTPGGASFGIATAKGWTFSNV